MAEINWGQMSPIQPPSVIAQLPQQPNQMDQFAGGLLSGIQQGQQIQSNNLALGKQRQEIADNEALRKAAVEGGDKWMQTLISQGKVDDAMQYQVHQQQYQNAILQNKASVIDLDTKERAKADRDNSINVAIMGAVSQLPPEQREAAFLQYKTDMQKQYPGLVMPDKFDANSMASVMRVNEVIQSQQTAEATEKVKTLTQLQNQRDILTKAKQVAIQAGKPTEEIDRKLQETQDLINTHTKNVQTQNTEQQATTEKVKVDAASYKDAQGVAEQVKVIEPLLSRAEELVKSIGDKAQGPIAGNVSHYWNEQVQELDQINSILMSNMRILMKYPAAGFSNFDAENMIKSVPGKLKDKSPNLAGIKNLRTIIDTVKRSAKDMEDRYNKEYRPSQPSGNLLEDEMRKRGLIK